MRILRSFGDEKGNCLGLEIIKFWQTSTVIDNRRIRHLLQAILQAHGEDVISRPTCIFGKKIII